MSFEASAYAKTLRTTPSGDKITRGEKLVLMVLADYHNPHRQSAWPSLPLLADEALTDVRRVRRELDELERKGVIKRLYPDNPGRGRFVEYELCELNKGGTGTPFPDEPKGGKKGGRKGGKKGGIKGGIDTLLNLADATDDSNSSRAVEQYSSRAVNPSEAQPASVGDELSLHDRIRSAIQGAFKKKFNLTCPWDGSEGKILQTIVGANPSWTPEQWRQMIKNFFNSEKVKADRPRLWLSNISKYYAGPLDRFGNTVGPVRSSHDEQLDDDEDEVNRQQELRRQQRAADERRMKAHA